MLVQVLHRGNQIQFQTYLPKSTLSSLLYNHHLTNTLTLTTVYAVPIIYMHRYHGFNLSISNKSENEFHMVAILLYCVQQNNNSCALFQDLLPRIIQKICCVTSVVVVSSLAQRQFRYYGL
jgi:hypothetical protein